MDYSIIVLDLSGFYTGTKPLMLVINAKDVFGPLLSGFTQVQNKAHIQFRYLHVLDLSGFTQVQN